MNPLEPVLDKVGKSLSDQYGIRVVCRGNRCCTDGKVIYLPALPDNIPEDLFQAIRGFIDHEAGHIGGKSDFVVGASFNAKYGGEAFGLLNILEDLRIEAYMARKYPGSAVNLSHAVRYAVKAATEKHAAGETMPALRQLAFAVHSRAHGVPDFPFVDAPVRAAADAILGEIRQAAAAPDTRTVAWLAESVWTKVEALFRSPPASGGPKDGPADHVRQAANSQSRSKDEGAAHNADGDSGSGDSDVHSPASGPHGRGARRTKNGVKAEDGGDRGSRTPSFSAPSAGRPAGSGTAAVAEDGPSVDAAAGEGTGLMDGLGRDIADAVAHYATAHGQYRAWTTEHDTVSVPKDISTVGHAERMASLLPHVAGVRQKLLQTLQAEVRARWLPDQERGRLNPRALHRLAAAGSLAKNNASAANEQTTALIRNIFRRRVVAKRLKTAVTLLVDVSHSMNGRKLDLAKATALVLCESLARLDIPVSVIAFSTQHHGKLLRDTAQAVGIPAGDLEKQYRFAPLIFERFKEFNEPFRKISGRFDQMRTHLMTPLGESVLFTARDLVRRPEPRKVLLVLTDGRPTVGLDNDLATFRHAKDSIVRVERAGIETVLIGIVERCVLDLHRRAVVVDRIKDLPGAVMNELRRLLTHDAPQRRLTPSATAPA